MTPATIVRAPCKRRASSAQDRTVELIQTCLRDFSAHGTRFTLADRGRAKRLLWFPFHPFHPVSSFRAWICIIVLLEIGRPGKFHLPCSLSEMAIPTYVRAPSHICCLEMPPVDARFDGTGEETTNGIETTFIGGSKVGTTFKT
jgi:hypothetical protein